MFPQHLILLFLSSFLAATHAAPMPMPSAPAPGEYRNVFPLRAENKNDPNARVGKRGAPHPAIVLTHPDHDNTHGIGTHPHAPIQDVHPETTLTGDVSLRTPLRFKEDRLQRAQHGVDGRPPPPSLSIAQVAHLRQRIAHVRAGGNGQIGRAPVAANHASTSRHSNSPPPAVGTSRKRKTSTDSHHSGSESPKPEDHVHKKQNVGGGSPSHHGSAPHSPVHNSPPHSPAHPHSPHHP